MLDQPGISFREFCATFGVEFFVPFDMLGPTSLDLVFSVIFLTDSMPWDENHHEFQPTNLVGIQYVCFIFSKHLIILANLSYVFGGLFC